MIPKIIHYCWLSGDPFPDLINKCIDSWHNILSDYEFMLWDTRKIDVNSNLWLKQAYENKKYAFAADYIRFFALYHYGGIYLDADVEVLKDFKSLLIEKQLLGEEASGDIEAAVIGAEKGADWVKSCLDYYANRPFVKEDGSFDTKPVPLLLNRIIQEKAFDIKPYYYFSPKDYNLPERYYGSWSGNSREVYFYNYQEEIIWGMTAEIIFDFIEELYKMEEEK